MAGATESHRQACGAEIQKPKSKSCCDGSPVGDHLVNRKTNRPEKTSGAPGQRVPLRRLMVTSFERVTSEVTCESLKICNRKPVT
jgi:hypothetical protein